MTTKKNTTINDYQNAMYSQGAVNASGLIHSLSEVMDKIWGDAFDMQMGSDWVNRHPILRLYLEQLVMINHAGWIQDSDGTYSAAYGLVQDVIDGKRNPMTLELKEEA